MFNRVADVLAMTDSYALRFGHFGGRGGGGLLVGLLALGALGALLWAATRTQKGGV